MEQLDLNWDIYIPFMFLNPLDHISVNAFIVFVCVCVLAFLWQINQWNENEDVCLNRFFTYAHYNDVIMDTIASQITSLVSVFSNVYSDAYQRKHQSSASLAFVRGIHRGPVNSPHKWPLTRKMFPFDDVIMQDCDLGASQKHVNRILFWPIWLQVDIFIDESEKVCYPL